MFRAAVVEARTEPVPPAWDAFVGTEGLPGVWGSTAVTRLAWCAPAATYLAIVVDRSGAPCALFHARHLGWRDRPSSYASAPAAAAHRSPGLVECRLPPTHSVAGFRFAASLSPPERREAVAAFEGAVRDRLGRRVPAIVYRNACAADLDVLRAGRGRRVCRPAAPEVVVENRWADVGAFLRDLPAKRRSELRRLDEALRADPVLAMGDEPAVEAAAASRLATTVARRHGRHRLPVVPVPASYVDALNGTPGVEFLTYRDTADGHRLLAFATVLDDGHELCDSVWGNLEGHDGGRSDLYFHHYLRAVGLLILRGRRCMSLGKGLVDIKLRYAGQPEARYLVGAGL